MPPKKSSKALAKLQRQVQRVEDESVKQQQRNRHLRLDVERLGTVLERRTRERDVAYAELETILERRPTKLKTVTQLTKEHDKVAKRLTKDARSNAASFTETAFLLKRLSRAVRWTCRRGGLHAGTEATPGTSDTPCGW